MISKSSAWSHGKNGDARERGTEDKIIMKKWTGTVEGREKSKRNINKP